jgi:hypothetical protein
LIVDLDDEIVRSSIIVRAEGQFTLGTFAAFAELFLATGQPTSGEVVLIILIDWHTGPLAAFTLMSSNAVSILTYQFYIDAQSK